MPTELQVLAPLKLPDERRPALMPPLPDWAALRTASVSVAWLNGRQVSQLPESLILSDDLRKDVLNHVSHLSKHLGMTPQTSADAEAQTLAIVAKMMLALPGQRATEDSAEAKGEAYMAALDDVAPWAVSEAVRRWYRAECGPKYNYAWAPAPGDLRTIALTEQARVSGRIVVLENIAYATPIVEFSDEHCAEMRAKMKKLSLQIGRMPHQQAAE